MARKTSADLALRKARQSSAALELNPAQIMRLLAALQGVIEQAKMAADLVLTHPATLAGSATPVTSASDAALVHPATLQATVTAVGATVPARFVIEAGMGGTLERVIPLLSAAYDVNVYRGPSGYLADDWQVAAHTHIGATDGWDQSAAGHVALVTDWQEGGATHLARSGTFAEAPRIYQLGGCDWQEGPPLGQQAGQPMLSLPPGHAQVMGLWVEGQGAGQWYLGSYRYPPRGDKPWQVSPWQGGARHRHQVDGQWHLGNRLDGRWDDGWDEATQPAPGVTPLPDPPITPPKPDKRRRPLVFGRPRGNASLEFVWYGHDAASVIPTRRVYLVSNAASLERVRDGLDIPTTGISIELDTDSWAWQFSAQIPRIAAASLTDGEEVVIHINGQQWQCVCDGWQSSESFGRQSATLTGRSRSAYLSPTHTLAQAVGEGSPATMGQLAAALLPVGWTLEWQAADWVVPGGFFSLDNQTPIEAIKYLADSAGAFVLPHQRNRHLVIKPRYPTAPWQLEDAVADVAIPRAIIITLGSDFQPGHAANGIWVSGGHQGISALVKRAGTAGERQAPAITHPLVCDVMAARAQGVVGLAKTMPRRTQTIELPLSADTGLILPGALLAIEGWKGYNRGVRVSAALSDNAMTVRQQLSVERLV